MVGDLLESCNQDLLGPGLVIKQMKSLQDPFAVPRVTPLPDRNGTMESENMSMFPYVPMFNHLDHPRTWPNELLAILGCHHDLFKQRIDGSRPIDMKAYDRTICTLREALQPYAIAGWHCTRLTKEEAASISADGLQPPNATMLNRRIDALVAAGSLTPQIAISLKAHNQASERSREGMTWFCFYPPRLAGERGIDRFFRHWGGEALYNSHENNPTTSPLLRAIGTPCIVEADVPISLLAKHDNLAETMVRRFLISQGFKTVEPTRYDGRITSMLQATHVRHVIQFTAPAFYELSGCSGWATPLT